MLRRLPVMSALRDDRAGLASRSLEWFEAVDERCRLVLSSSVDWYECARECVLVVLVFRVCPETGRIVEAAPSCLFPTTEDRRASTCCRLVVDVLAGSSVFELRRLYLLAASGDLPI